MPGSLLHHNKHSQSKKTCGALYKKPPSSNHNMCHQHSLTPAKTANVSPLGDCRFGRDLAGWARYLQVLVTERHKMKLPSGSANRK
eukprot:3422324-Amphidinium_carterae.1